MGYTRINSEATLRLLRAIQNVETISESRSAADLIDFGLILVDGNNQPIKEVDYKVASDIVDILGIKVIDWSHSFHKSWDKVATAPINQLISEQIFHYFSTYGMESLGARSLNHIPVEEVLVDFDGVPAGAAFTVIRVLNEKEMCSAIADYLKNTVTIHKNNVNYVRVFVNVTPDINIDEIKSFEIKVMYAEARGVVPSNAADFLRLAVYLSSNGNRTSLVKDKETINLIKMYSTSVNIERLFANANLEKLSENFYRFKPLFLAFKRNKRLAPIINKIRRLANKNHKPLGDKSVANLVNIVRQNRMADAMDIITRASNRDLVKIINFTLAEPCTKNHVYNIRNGKTYINLENKEIGNKNEYNIVRFRAIGELVNRLRNVYAGRVFYIPAGVDYAAPISEKQMLDVIPYGTKIELAGEANALCISGHWFNKEDQRVDLDFHMSSVLGSVGWNSQYRTATNDVLFSGDMTDAPKPYGAVESFRIDKSVDVPYSLSVSVYSGGETEYDIMFTKDCVDKSAFTRGNKTMLSAITNPENAIAPMIHLKANSDNTIGYYNNKSFIFYGGELGNKRVPNTEMRVAAIEATITRCEHMLKLKDLIYLVGGLVVDTIPEEGEFINLAPNNLTTTTLFDVVDGRVS